MKVERRKNWEEVAHGLSKSDQRIRLVRWGRGEGEAINQIVPSLFVSSREKDRLPEPLKSKV